MMCIIVCLQLQFSVSLITEMQVVEDHFISEKNSFYDLILDAPQRATILASQDRKLRYYDVVTGKETRCLKGEKQSVFYIDACRWGGFEVEMDVFLG